MKAKTDRQLRLEKARRVKEANEKALITLAEQLAELRAENYSLRKQVAERTPVSFAERLPPAGVRVLGLLGINGEWEVSPSGVDWTQWQCAYTHWLPIPTVEAK